METEAKNSIDPSLISVRDLELGDLPHIMNYWFRSPQGFVESIGVDLEKLPTEDFMREHLTKRLQINSALDKSKLNALVILYGNKPIGFHTLVPFTEGESGIFHAHIWQTDMRKRGVGYYSYPQACTFFMNRFNLQKIIFKTPEQNIGAIKVKEKLGIRCVGQEAIGFDIIKDGTIGKVFELTRTEAMQNWMRLIKHSTLDVLDKLTAIRSSELDEQDQKSKTRMRHMNELKEEDNRIFFTSVEPGEEHVAYVQLILKNADEDLELANGKDVAHVHDLRVHNEWRRKGIGELTMQKLEAEAKKLGIKVLTLGVDSPNIPARAMYENLGYKEFKSTHGRTADEMCLYLKKQISE